MVIDPTRFPLIPIRVYSQLTELVLLGSNHGFSSIRMTGGSAAPVSGAGMIKEGVDADAGSSGLVGGGVAGAGVAEGTEDAALVCPRGACHPGIVNSIPCRIFAGSEILFAVAISPTVTWYFFAIAPSVSPERTTCLTSEAEERAAGGGFGEPVLSMGSTTLEFVETDFAGMINF
jgi:hypothetical protein